MDKAGHKHQAHVGFATIAIALMAFCLAAGLDFLGIIDRLNAWIAAVMLKPGISSPVQTLDSYLLWIITVLLALSLAAIMLNISGCWRRLVIWAFATIITLFWVPVLLLASYKPDIGVALVGLLWSGCCAMVYTLNHEMPADLMENNNTTKTDATR